MAKRRSFRERLRKFAYRAAPFAALAAGAYLGDKYLQHQLMLKNKEERSKDAELLTARPTESEPAELLTARPSESEVDTRSEPDGSGFDLLGRGFSFGQPDSGPGFSFGQADEPSAPEPGERYYDDDLGPMDPFDTLPEQRRPIRRERPIRRGRRFQPYNRTFYYP